MMLNIEDLIPHRDRMKLIDRIIDLKDEYAVTESVTSDEWPGTQGGLTNPIVAIELVAQTAGIHEGAIKLLGENKKLGGRGWLVGIKKAEFYIDGIPVGTKLVTESRKGFRHENYGEVDGTVKIGDRIIAEVGIQVFQSPDEFDGGL